MKKTLLAIAFAAATLCAVAQRPTLSSRTTDRTFLPGEQAALGLQQAQPKSNYNYFIDNYHADDDFEIFNYFYRDGRCIAIENFDGYEGLIGSIHVFDSLRYDERGDLVRLDCYQYMTNSQSWQYVNWCEYTYDDQHRMLTRTNYNIFGGEPNLGGVYHFEYNAQGLLQTRYCSFFGLDRYDEMTYTYDAQGRLTQTLYKIINMDNYPDPTLHEYERVEYSYNAAGQLTQVSFTAKDANSGAMTTYKREYYTYSSRGDCIRYESFTGAGRELEKRYYEYWDLPLAETLIPKTFEHTEPYTYQNTNTYHTMHWYAANDNDELTYVCDYLFNYIDRNGNAASGNHFASIDQAAGQSLSLYPNPATDHITVAGQQGDNMLYLYSLDGRLAHMQRLSGTDARVDLSGLARGTYIVRVNGTNPRNGKIIVK